jgi:hypothetical protein
MIRSLTRFAVLALLALVVFPVFAQTLDGGTDPLLSDLTTVAQTATAASHNGVAGVLAVIVASLVLVTRLATRFGSKLPGKVGEWFATPVATWVIPLVLSTLGALLTALTSGQPLSLGLFVGAIMAGLAGGGFGSVPAFIKQEQLAKADAAGADAAAKVTDTASAADVMRGHGPTP